MRYHRFVSNFRLVDRHVKIFDKELIDQVRRVLRLGVGDRIILCDGDCNEALIEIGDIGKEKIDGRVVEVWKNENEIDRNVILYCSVLKRDNFELVVQKATEVGVSKIGPLVCARTVKTGLRRDRLEKIIKEAAEQSGRGVVPELADAINFEEALEGAQENDANLFFDASGDKGNWGNKGDRVRINIFIGPEGGWEEKEIKMVREKNFRIVGLGKSTLRAETAAIIASYLACGPYFY